MIKQNNYYIKGFIGCDCEQKVVVVAAVVREMYMYLVSVFPRLFDFGALCVSEKCNLKCVIWFPTGVLGKSMTILVSRNKTDLSTIRNPSK